ncbi:TetR family transcriptional regulator [Sphaerisporangium krabiense]|uniref:AcrR family transcriptional regulator n=1 Tax=Sphaerisporangium krabiense TaxID=763782 RepID=A0A7W9DQA6_9ACTN|nr:TetR/AcrR family transcriptional regulator [Sphaerisporangium krabiense]MBB5627306.1 AcrR family transcriptional regulator [Sphaerisporangium krabiense]GII64559.1 TetR family transcriptional regulator [Sphaerisporangium krabiense]
MSEPHPPRRDQRRHTHERILAHARALFATKGFERTTIRAVAAQAGVDPALVMQHFGSKQRLFDAATAAESEPTPEADTLLESLLNTLEFKLHDQGRERMAMLRSMLTHPEATERVRVGLDHQSERIAAALPGGDAGLRGDLAASLMLGVRIGRDLLGLAHLSDASPDQVLRLMRPVFEALVDAGAREA